MDFYLRQLADQHAADLRHEAEHSRLARLVGCCRPSTWTRWARGLDARFRRSRVCCV
jgi:hypothetical protein